ncbi:MAG: PD40 domain-containing protein [Paraprevotella sp.]|nr:PD40 domain-containing protein [Paraprevotella sp.]
MKTKLFALICLLLPFHGGARAASDAPLWIRWSAISPDGKTIAFCYQGDIYLVPSSGGSARQLTTNTSYDYAPVWSPDGKHIAFASDREGSMDVFLTTVEGGTPLRLTTHSGREVPLAFADAEHVLYSAVGTPSTDNMQFPSGTFFQVYSVDIKEGSRPTVYSDLPMADLSVGRDGRVLYNDVKGYEDYWRKHQTSSISRDVWMYDGKKYSRLTTFKGEDRDPVWAPDGKGFYYLSEQDGTMNVYFRQLTGGQEKKLTDFKNNPVRFLSVADDGRLAYCYDGELYTQAAGGSPTKVDIHIVKDAMTREVVKNHITSGAAQVSVSPKGKEIAFIMAGNVYVTSLDYSTTKQITDTPELERTVDFGPDGRSLVYASERDGVWQVYQTTIVNEKEKQFTYATDIKEERLTDGKYTAFQPAYNPKGGEVAFLKDRTELCVIDLKSKKVRTVMDGKYQYSYTDGDQTFCWSPDGKWLLTEYIGTGGWNNKDIALVKADGKGEIHNLTNSGYSESSPKWVLDGKAMLFTSDRAGYRAHGSWGSQDDIYIMFFDLEAYERFRMNKEELALLEEKEKAEKEEKEKAEAKKKEAEDKKKKKSKGDKKKEEDKKEEDKKDEDKKDEKLLAFDFEHLDERTIRLTPYSTSIGDFVLSKDATKLYYVAPHEGHGALWVQHLKEYRNELKNRNMDWASLDVDGDVKFAYYASGGRIRKMEVENGNVSDISFETFSTHRPAEVRKYLFNHIWKQTKDKLYVKDMNGVDWDGIYKTYVRYLPHITNSYDFAEMASEMLGELNVSHTGCRFGGVYYALGTASLGLFYDRDYKGDGLKIKEIMPGSPFAVRKTDVEPGCVIVAIDGEKIKAGEDYYPLLAGKAGRYTRLTVEKKGKTFDVTVKPVSSGNESAYLYKRWVDRNRKMVDKLSGGRLAYVHVKAMDGGSFHTLYKELLSDENRNKDAVIVDTRHNGGGWLHGDICVLLSGKRTIEYKPRGQFIGNDPFDRWVKPSCMLICEDNYSNAHGTPWMYKELGLGKLVGAPVPGTMTAVWWEGINEFVFGIPQVASVDNRGEYLENQQLEPDVEVYTKPEEILSGTDRQLERAVTLMLEEVESKKN